jgi:organic radical activating enzyme
MLRTLPLIDSWLDYPDKESLAVCVCFAGCSHNCRLCHNRALQNYNNPTCTAWENPDDLYNEIVFWCKKNRTDKVVFTGGDPLFEKNRREVSYLSRILSTDFDICIYTGFDIDDVKGFNLDLRFKYIKCGKFDASSSRPSIKTDKELCLASPNQAFYDEDYKLISKNGVLKLA